MTRPVFIIGSARSGTSILTWSLGQHPNLYPLEETVWIGQFGRWARRAYEIGASRGARSHLSGMGIERSLYMRRFGEAIDGMILEHRKLPAHDVAEEAAFTLVRRVSDPKQRWVDGTPENSCFVPELHALFPEARFIHLLRDPVAVVRSLGNFVKAGGESKDADDACRVWLRQTGGCRAAETRLPAETIMRLEHRELEVAPELAVRRCLDFLGEPWSEDCLKPLNHRINSSAPASPPVDIEVDPALLDEIRSLCSALGLEPPAALVPRPVSTEEPTV